MDVTVVTGPPCAGKSTWIAERAQPGDVVIDLDRIALALTADGTPHHDYPQHVREVARAARLAAIDAALADASAGHVWIIDTAASKKQRAAWHRRRCHVVTLDPGPAVVAQRIDEQRPAWVHDVAHSWYWTQASETRR